MLERSILPSARKTRSFKQDISVHALSIIDNECLSNKSFTISLATIIKDYLVIPNDLEIDVKTDLIEENVVNNPYRYLGLRTKEAKK